MIVRVRHPKFVVWIYNRSTALNTSVFVCFELGTTQRNLNTVDKYSVMNGMDWRLPCITYHPCKTLAARHVFRKEPVNEIVSLIP
jgi:hypothetical protein